MNSKMKDELLRRLKVSKATKQKKKDMMLSFYEAIG